MTSVNISGELYTSRQNLVFAGNVLTLETRPSYRAPLLVWAWHGKIHIDDSFVDEDPDMIFAMQDGKTVIRLDLNASEQLPLHLHTT